MAYERNARVLPQRAASAVGAMEVVAQVGAVFPASSIDETVIPLATFVAAPFGVSRASHAANEPVDTIVFGEAKCKAGASLGQGVPVGLASGVGSSLGLVPLVYSGTSVPARYSVGLSMQSAVVGDIFTVSISPQQVI